MICSCLYFSGKRLQNQEEILPSAGWGVFFQLPTYPDTEHVKFRTLPAVTYAGCTFKGSYAQINDVVAAVSAWVEDNGYDYAGPMFDIYHVSPHETQNPDEFVTEVCFPVKKK